MVTNGSMSPLDALQLNAVYHAAKERHGWSGMDFTAARLQSFPITKKKKKKKKKRMGIATTCRNSNGNVTLATELGQ
jgi:hypothetical protein